MKNISKVAMPVAKKIVQNIGDAKLGSHFLNGVKSVAKETKGELKDYLKEKSIDLTKEFVANAKEGYAQGGSSSGHLKNKVNETIDNHNEMASLIKKALIEGSSTEMPEQPSSVVQKMILKAGALSMQISPEEHKHKIAEATSHIAAASETISEKSVKTITEIAGTIVGEKIKENVDKAKSMRDGFTKRDSFISAPLPPKHTIRNANILVH